MYGVMRKSQTFEGQNGLVMASKSQRPQDYPTNRGCHCSGIRSTTYTHVSCIYSYRTMRTSISSSRACRKRSCTRSPSVRSDSHFPAAPTHSRDTPTSIEHRIDSGACS